MVDLNELERRLDEALYNDFGCVFGKLHKRNDKRAPDQIAVSEFLKIVRNYLKMERILNNGYKGI